MPHPLPQIRTVLEADDLAQRRRREQLTFTLVVFLFLGVLTPAQVLLGEEFGSTNPAFWLSLGILEYCAVRIAVLASGQLRLISLTFFFFLYIWIGWSGSFQIYVWRFPWWERHTPDDMFVALALIAMAIGFYELGQYLARRRTHAIERGTLSADSATIPLKRLQLLTVFATAAFGIGVMYFGIGHVLGTRATMRGGAGGGNPTTMVMLMLLRQPCFILLMCCIQIWWTRWRELRQPEKRMVLAILVFSAAMTFVANYPPAVPRSWLGTILIMPLFLLTPRSRQASLAWVFLLAFGLMWVFPRADLFRKARNLSEALERLESQEAVRRHIVSADYDVLQMSTNSMIYVRDNGLMWGENIGAAVLFFVPRKIWRDKPRRTDVILAQGLNYRANNLSVPLWAEGYLAFGTTGVALLFTLYGYLSRYGEIAYLVNRSRKRDGPRTTGGVVAILVPFFAAYQFYFLRGDLINGVAFGALVLAMILLVHQRAAGRSARRIAMPAAP